jgi:hypothetical protein
MDTKSAAPSRQPDIDIDIDDFFMGAKGWERRDPLVEKATRATVRRILKDEDARRVVVRTSAGASIPVVLDFRYEPQDSPYTGEWTRPKLVCQTYEYHDMWIELPRSARELDALLTRSRVRIRSGQRDAVTRLSFAIYVGIKGSYQAAQQRAA